MCVCVRVLCALQVRDQLTPEIMAEIEEGFGADTYPFGAILNPRQARDKHRKCSQKGAFFVGNKPDLEELIDLDMDRAVHTAFWRARM